MKKLLKKIRNFNRQIFTAMVIFGKTGLAILDFEDQIESMQKSFNDKLQDGNKTNA